jgi:hypothetical protein
MHKRHDWMLKHTAASFVDFARTRSDHQMLPEAVREALLAEVKGAIVKNAGAFDSPYETRLYGEIPALCGLSPDVPSAACMPDPGFAARSTSLSARRGSERPAAPRSPA